ncbi:uncharacterized protein BXIN_0730 [Babesia sp. Xinjiang]|uniref:uncharacterized protein n=1 Tax=Babesia sp. Xinjiang TaxID=462227 RepID=UPI000A21A0AD|nr:uncharacterized protein BXIN_0669 [Babesia sp. Xinjiang]XP_028872619.1 uncharacterized protein BXIN_0730 [Babesia sp. Xinjiang]ORM42114.1 hypothetical protein BXIN_0669 [Babesia sp. Xinjiang]ORM42163.1 hypothetical protein BXIN_0730 [Babesia sp. Xinjiang]
MFAKRSLLGKNRDKGSSSVSSAPSSVVNGGNTSAQKGGSSESTDSAGSNRIPSDNTHFRSFRRGLRIGGASLHPKESSVPSDSNRTTVGGGRSGLSFTDDLDSQGDVCIRKGVRNCVVESGPLECEVDKSSAMIDGSLRSNVAPAGRQSERPQPEISESAFAESFMYMDVDGESLYPQSNDTGHENRYNHVESTSVYGNSTRRMLGLSSDDSGDETYYVSDRDSTNPPSATNCFDALPPFDSKEASRYLNGRLDEMREELSLLRRNIESCKGQIEDHRKVPNQYEPVMDGVRKNVDLFRSLASNARALGGLLHAKHGLLQEVLQTKYDNEKDIADASYCVHRWFLCDLLRIDGILCDYSCGYLDETDDDGLEVCHKVKRTFDTRADQLDDVLSKLKEMANHRAEELGNASVGPDNTSVCDAFMECFTLSSLYDDIVGIYPSSDLKPVEKDVMHDVADKYSTISNALAVYQSFKESHSEEFEQFRISERLRSVYELYVVADLVSWDPLAPCNDEVNKLSGREWFKFVSKFCPESLPQLVLDFIVPACINAIDTWNIADARQSLCLSSLLVETIKHLPPESRGDVIDKLTSHFLKIAELRLTVLCPNNIGKSFQDWYISGFWKFLLVRVASNLMYFSTIFTGATLSKLVLDGLFSARLLPTLDFNQMLDAFVVLQFFTHVKELSSHLRVQSRTNALIKATVHGIGARTWVDDLGVSLVFDRLKVSLTNDYYARTLNSIFG